MNEEAMTIRAVGRGINGRLPLSEIARIAGELQATLERLALSLLGSTPGPGRRPRDVADAVRLELTAFRAGSAVLEVAPAQDALINHALLVASTDLLFEGLGEIQRRGEHLRPEFTPQVLDGLIRLSGGISPGAVERLEFSRGAEQPIEVDEGWRQHVRWLRRQRRQDLVSIVGRLHEGDFDPLALRCRIDTVESTVPCSFAQDMRDRVLGAMDAMVIASGVAEVQPDGRIRTLDIDDLTVIDEAKRRTIDQLAREQGIGPVQDVAEFATVDDLDDDDFGTFMSDVLSAR